MKNPAEMKPATPLTRFIVVFLFPVLVFHLFTIQSFAQEFGRFKPGINWQQISTPAVRVIFPKGLESQATRVANNILYINKNNRTSIGPLSKKLDLILNNQGIISNGYFTLMPFRSEFFTIPLQDGNELGTTEWLDILSVHEYRHALQYMNLRRGFNKLAYYFSGEIGWGVMVNLAIPGWYFEGDAVATETALTNQGRGRIPSFLKQSKSILLNDRKYSYMKARNGSYRDIVPNQYELGYLLCSYGREKFGNDLWPKVINQTSWFDWMIYPFSTAVRTHTGMNTRQFYNKALSDYKKKWKKETSTSGLTPFSNLSHPAKTITNYRFPVFEQDGNLLVYKDSYKEIGAIYRISPDGKEEKICTTGISLDPYYTASGNLLTWTEVTWDERFSSKSYSDVIVYQSDLSKKTFLTRKQRYFSPAFSPDGTRIVVVESDYSNNCRLIILDSKTGTKLTTLPNPEFLYYTYPKWDIDGKSIITSARTLSGKSIIIQQLPGDGSINKLSSEYNHNIGEVLVTPATILFSASFSGTNNLFSLNRGNGFIIQLTGSKFGAYYPAMSPDGMKLVYSDFNITGYGLVMASTDSLLMKAVEPVPLNKMEMFDFSYFQKEGGNIFDKIPDQKLEISPYNLWKHPVRLHSWIISPGYYSAGINLISDNIFNNLHVEGGFNYYYNESSPGFSAKVQYGGIYPVLSAGISRYYRQADELSVMLGTDTARTISLDNQFSLELQVPLNFTKGEYYRHADISLGYNYIFVKNLREGNSINDNSLYVSALAGKARFLSVMKKAYQNISTPIGVGLELSASQSIGFTNASQYQAIGDFAVRGLFPNHNLILSAGWKYEPDKDRYHFMDLFLYPRGYLIPRYNSMFTLQSTYHFPLFYPDFGFWGIVYCSRVRTSVFADYGYALIPDSFNNFSNKAFASVGSELIFDTKWFNLASIPLGIRFSLLLTPDNEDPQRKTRLEIIIPVLRL